MIVSIALSEADEDWRQGRLVGFAGKTARAFVTHGKEDVILGVTENDWLASNSIVLHYLFKEDLLNCWVENGLQEKGVQVATGRHNKRTLQQLITGDGFWALVGAAEVEESMESRYVLQEEVITHGVNGT